MSVKRLSEDTISVTDLVWVGNGFADPTANQMWAELPEALRRVAVEEVGLGNMPWNILRNSARGIVLLAFRDPPMTQHDPTREICVHRSFHLGNYCYEGTYCTYEHFPSGCFLAFNDQGFDDDA